MAVLAVTGATAAMLTERSALGVLNTAQLYLILSFILTVTIGPGPGTFAAVAAALAFDFFFIPPYLTFSPARGDHVAVLFAFLIIALVTGSLVSRLQAQAETARAEQQRTAQLVEFTSAMLGKGTRDGMLAAIAEHIVRISGAARCRVLLYGNDGHLVEQAVYPPLALAPIGGGGVAPVTNDAGHPTDIGLTPHATTGPTVRTVPIANGHHVFGLLEIAGASASSFGDEEDLLLAGIANQTVLALERAQLLEEAAHATIMAEADQLKSALLAAVSHDLRTPLTTIRTAATSLLDASVGWDEEDGRLLLQTIDDQAQRLSRLVGNLLDLSRIEGGVLRADKVWSRVGDLVEDVVAQLTRLGSDHPVSAEVEPDLPLVRFDPVQIAQVLTNLGENAIKHTPAGTPITFTARKVRDAVEFAVRDTGPGIAAERQPHLFEKFYRVEAAGPGIGLGLVICKGLVEANGGKIWVESQAMRGTTFRFTIPLAEEGATGARDEC